MNESNSSLLSFAEQCLAINRQGVDIDHAPTCPTSNTRIGHLPPSPILVSTKHIRHVDPVLENEVQFVSISKSPSKFLRSIRTNEDLERKAYSHGVTPARTFHDDILNLEKHSLMNTHTNLDYNNAHLLMKSVNALSCTAFKISRPKSNLNFHISCHMQASHKKTKSNTAGPCSPKKNQLLTSHIRNKLFETKSKFTRNHYFVQKIQTESISKLALDTTEKIKSVYKKIYAHDQIFKPVQSNIKKSWRCYLHEPEYALQLMSKHLSIDVPILIRYLHDYAKILNYSYPMHLINMPTNMFLSQLLTVASLSTLSSFQFMNAYRQFENKSKDIMERLAEVFGIEKSYFSEDSSVIIFEK